MTQILAKWQQLIKDTITKPEDLVSILGLPDRYLSAARKSADLFPLRVPMRFINRMTKGDPNDPLLRQVLPLADEQARVPGFVSDPLAEKLKNPIPGVLHKYKNRILLTPTGACAGHCRYCFRREFDYRSNTLGRPLWPSVVHYIQEHPEIDEVILSGGDPLSAPDQFLQELVDVLEKLPQLTRLRIHTRFPIFVPERLTDELISIFQETRLIAVFVIHANHPNELADSVLADRLRLLSSTGTQVLNQSVLLKGVNDSVACLKMLGERLIALGVLPYYLHLLDPVRGTHHFQVDAAQAGQLVDQLRKETSGYLVPTLVKEESGEASKTAL